MLAAAAAGRVASDELREQYRLMQLKRMLLRYGIHVVNISDISLARGLVRAVVGHATEPTDAVLRDGLQIVSAYHHLSAHDVYTTRLRYLAAANRLTTAEAAAVVLGLPANEAVAALLETVAWLQETVEDGVLDAQSVAPSGAQPSTPTLVALGSDARTRLLNWLDAALAVWALLVQPTYTAQPAVAAQLAAPTATTSLRAPDMWAAQRTLVVEFALAAPWSVLASAAGRRSLVRAFTAGVVSASTATVENAERRPGKALTGGSFTQMQRLADTLHLDRAELLALLAETEAAHGHLSAALEHCHVRRLVSRLPTIHVFCILTEVRYARGLGPQMLTARDGEGSHAALLPPVMDVLALQVLPTLVEKTTPDPVRVLSFPGPWRRTAESRGADRGHLNGRCLFCTGPAPAPGRAAVPLASDGRPLQRARPGAYATRAAAAFRKFQNKKKS